MPRSSLLSIAAIALLSAALVYRAATPPDAAPATASATAFSAERAMRHVRAMAQRPHPIGSADNARVREYLLAELKALGTNPHVQEATGVGTRSPNSGLVRNVVARLAGTDPQGHAVMLVSHYDGVPAGPAAADAASGVAAILETVRALRAGPPLAHDVIVLLTDGEEAGLLGAAAFAREHPWADDARMILNFEARGTHGRSFMFETGEGNLDAVRTLRTLPDISASSLMVFVYRVLPNDTDLSELDTLATPMMNFGFINGVERYHTPSDNVAHLDRRSLQHHGVQALALTRAFASDTLPRPRTGDAVFFDVPLLGLVTYPEPWAIPLAVLAVLLVAAAAVRARRAATLRLGATLLELAGVLAAIAAAAVVALGVAAVIVAVHRQTGWAGAAQWRDAYVAAVAFAALAVATAAWTAVRRRVTESDAHVGVLMAWTALVLVTAVMAPGASYVLTWPLLFAAAAALFPHAATGWLATVVTLTILVPLVYLFGVALGIQPPAVIANAALVTLGTWLIGPHLARLRAARWHVPIAAGAVAVALMLVGFMTVRASADAPTPRSRTLVVDVDRGTAWMEPAAGGSSEAVPVTIGDIGAPAATVLSDSSAGDARHLVFRVTAPPGTSRISMSSQRAEVRSATVNGRPISAASYRVRSSAWMLRYHAPPDSGVTISMMLPRGAPFELDLAAQFSGLQPEGAAAVPARKPFEVSAHGGDLTIVQRRVHF